MKFDTVIPAGGVYVTTDGTELKEGDMLLVPKNKDRFVYEDYEYTYCKFCSGWNVVVINKTKPSYSEILESIGGMPVVSLYSCFSSCNNLIEAPKIPFSVINMWAAFYGCELLTGNIIIPKTVTNLDGTFVGCKSLKIVTFENENADIKYTFDDDVKIKIKGLSKNAIHAAKKAYSNIKFEEPSKLSKFLGNERKK